MFFKRIFEGPKAVLPTGGPAIRVPQETGPDDHEGVSAEEPAFRLPGAAEASILNSLSDLVIYHEADHRIAWANRAAGASAGLPAEELVGRFCYDVWRKRTSPCERCPVSHALKTGMPREAELQSPDGRAWFIKAHPVIDGGGKVRGAVEVAQDVTVRKRSEEAALESRERYSALFDRSLYLVFVNDFRDRFLDANKAALDLLGYTREDISRLTFSSLLDVSQLPRAFRAMGEVLKTGSQKHPVEYRLHRKDGSTVWVEVEASIVHHEGASPVIQSIARDITDHKRAEEELKASIKEKEVLLREVHHRVKNNLQVISSLLDMKSMRSQNPRLIELCADARAKIQTMALIHTQLYQSERFTKIDMKSYTLDLFKYLSHVYSGRSRHVTADFRLSEVFLNVTQAIPFAIVLNEILSNAFKHAFGRGRRGRIEITLRQSPSGRAFLHVRDNGSGLPREVDFESADTLGLKLMRNLVRDQLKGRIRLGGKNGTGVTIDFKVSPLEELRGTDPGR